MHTPTVLVVDDERGFLQIVQIILQRAGYQPLLANNASEALKFIDTKRPDAIILDDDMPGLSGGDLCQRLKADPRTRHIRVVMFSANERIRDPEFLASIQADGAISKPAMPADILSTLEASLHPHAQV